MIESGSHQEPKLFLPNNLLARMTKKSKETTIIQQIVKSDCQGGVALKRSGACCSHRMMFWQLDSHHNSQVRKLASSEKDGKEKL